MSETISFVANDELVEWIEAEAERRMTTISSTAQMLLAEKYREDQRRASEASESRRSARLETSGAAGDDATLQVDGVDVDERIETIDAAMLDAGHTPPVLEDRPELWHEPDSEQYVVAVEVPEDLDVSDAGKKRYFESASGAAEAIRRWYE